MGLMIAIIQALPWKKLLKFAITGGTAFAIDAGLYLLLTRFGHWPYLTARTASLGVAMGWNFTLNRNWTFRAQDGRVGRQAARFLTVMTATSLMSLGLMRIGVGELGLNDVLVLVVVSILMMGVNYTAHQFWSYKN